MHGIPDDEREWEGRLCDTCRYVNVDLRDYPCNGCYRKRHSRWEAKPKRPDPCDCDGCRFAEGDKCTGDTASNNRYGGAQYWQVDIPSCGMGEPVAPKPEPVKCGDCRFDGVTSCGNRHVPLYIAYPPAYCEHFSPRLTPTEKARLDVVAEALDECHHGIWDVCWAEDLIRCGWRRGAKLIRALNNTREG